MEDKEFWYFTFGVCYYHRDDIVKIQGDFESTRRRMKELFGDHWAFQYSEEDGIQLIAKYGYNLIVVE